jgi:hypothetical protein
MNYPPPPAIYSQCDSVERSPQRGCPKDEPRYTFVINSTDVKGEKA